LSLAAGRRSPLVEVRLRNNRLEASAAGLQTLPGSVVGSDDEVRWAVAFCCRLAVRWGVGAHPVLARKFLKNFSRSPIPRGFWAEK